MSDKGMTRCGGVSLFCGQITRAERPLASRGEGDRVDLDRRVFGPKRADSNHVGCERPLGGQAMQMGAQCVLPAGVL